MKKTMLKIGVGVLHAVYLPFRLCKVKNKIVYISRQSDSMSLDFELLVSRMQKERPDVKNVVLARKISGGNKSILTYPFHMLRQMYHLATSKVVVLDGYCIVACVLPHKKETKVVQMWHAAAAIKKFGYQTLNKPSGSDSEMAKIMKMHHHYDYVLAPSTITGKHYQEAFGVSKEKIVYIGMPHFSTLGEFDVSEEMDDVYPILQEKTNILYIPTFRKGESVRLDELIQGVDFEKYNLIAQLHPLDLVGTHDDRVIYDKQFTVYDWIKKADIVITDYSSLIIECVILKKRLYFYLYDLEKYALDPGLNLDFEAEGLGQFIFQDGYQLNNVLQKEYDYEALQQFEKKYVEIDVDSSLQQLVKMITT